MISAVLIALANVAGLAIAAVALVLLVRATGGRWPGLRSRRELGLLSIFLAGCLLVVGGQSILWRKLLESTARAGIQARIQVALGGPLDAITVHVRGPDTFRLRPDESSLRLIATTKSGQTLTSEVPSNRMILTWVPYKGLYEWGYVWTTSDDFREYKIAWQSVVEGATSEEGRMLASRVVNLNDWRRFDRVIAEVIVRPAKNTPMPDSLRIATLADPPVELFHGIRAVEEAGPRGGAWVCEYQDVPWASSPERRLTGWMAEEAIRGPRLGLDVVSIGLLAAVSSLLAAGLGLLNGNITRTHRVPAWAAPAFVWGVWALMLFATLAYIYKYANNIPFADDWAILVPYMSGRSITASYLWQQEFEHRYPLTKAVALSLVKVSGDIRATTLFKTLVLGGLAYAMIRLARGVRGRTSYTDAFFPLALLLWGFSAPLDLGWGHVAYLVPTIVASPFLWIAVRSGTRLTLGTAMLAGSCLALLPLCSATGLLYLPFIALWLGYSAVISWRSPCGKRTGLVLVVWILAAFLIVMLYFRGLDRSQIGMLRQPSASVWETCCSGLKALTSVFGEAARWTWPFSGLAMLILIAFGTGFLILAAWYDGQGLSRHRALGLLFFLGASGMVALGLGWGRPDITLILYPTLNVLFVCAIYYVWLLVGPAPVGHLAQVFLVACAGLALMVAIPARLQAAREEHASKIAFERDLRRGLPPHLLIALYGNNNLGVNEMGEVIGPLHMLRRAGVGSFRYLRDDLDFRCLPLPLEPTETKGVRWEEGMAKGNSGEAYLKYCLPKTMFIDAVRIRCSLPQSSPTDFVVSWKKRGMSHPYYPSYVEASWPFASDIIVPVADQINEIYIYPNSKPGVHPFRFRPSKIEVLLAEEREGEGRDGPPKWEAE